MSKLAARKGDKHDCPEEEPKDHGKGSIIEGSPNVTIEGMPAARVGDKIECEDGSTTPIADNGSCLLINGKKAARIGDKSDHDGEISSSAGSVFIADGDAFIEFGDEGSIEIGENVYFGGEGTVLNPQDYHLTEPMQEALAKFAEYIGKDVIVTGGSRRPDSDVGSKSTSQHAIGDAADIKVKGQTHL
jgi:uncharacterized Zn-binding protein involved in type VI secretion